MLPSKWTINSNRTNEGFQPHFFLFHKSESSKSIKIKSNFMENNANSLFHRGLYEKSSVFLRFITINSGQWNMDRGSLILFFYYRDNYLIICSLHFRSFAAVSDPMNLLIFSLHRLRYGHVNGSVFRRWIFVQLKSKWIELKLTGRSLEGTWLVNQTMNPFNGI